VGSGFSFCFRFLLATTLSMVVASAFSFGQATCSLNPANQTVTICTPATGATGLTSPVQVNAGTTDSNAIKVMWIYVNGTKTYSVLNQSFVNVSVAMPAGTDRLTVQAQDSTGVIFKATEYVGVGSTATAITPPSVTLAQGATQQFTANQAVTWSASCGSITSGGLYTAPNSPGACTVTAASTSGGGTANATVTVLSVSSYVMWKNDLGRTGQQPNEVVLTPQNVNVSTFGKKFSDTVDGFVYGQPLYVAGLTIGGAIHNVIFLTTENDSVYALDADVAGPPLWKVNLLSAGVTAVPQANVHSTIYPVVGITGTPVLDVGSNTLYVVAETLENNGTAYIHRLHALDLTSGAEKFGGPVVISGGGFASQTQLQRAGLLLLNGIVYVAFGSQGDYGTYHGYIFSYSASTLAQIAIFNDDPSGTRGGIWMAGAAPAVDSSGNIYVPTGNGSFAPTSGNYGDSYLKLSPGLSILDFFTPDDEAYDNGHDVDVGSGGPLVVPDQSGAYPHELIGCGKPNDIYVMNRDQMGQFNSTSNNVIQVISGAVGGAGVTEHCFMTPAFWQQNVYFVGNQDVIKAFSLDPGSGLLSTAPTSQGSFVFPFPGAQPVVSSNGAGNGIVWAVDHNNPAVLHAFDATNVATELYNSSQAGTRDNMGYGTKWAVPTIVNGKVYIGTNGRLVVYGLL
jgi:hypothetical protein